jgi:hypothetical protein
MQPGEQEPVVRERRAYNRWTEADVVKLAELYGSTENNSFKTICGTLGRDERSVRSMVGKLRLHRAPKG